MPQRRKLQITIRQLEIVRVLARSMLFYVELRRQCRPLTFRPMPAPKDRKARATQRILRVRDCRMIKTQAQLNGMQIQQGVLFRDLPVVTKIMRSM